MLIAGSTNELHYATTVAGVATEADTIAVVVTDAAGAVVALSDTPTWNAVTSVYDLTIASTECLASYAGTVWTLVWTWTHDTATLRDVETIPVGTSGGNTWTDYVAVGGSLIAESEWPRYRRDALRVLEDITFGRIATTTDASDLAKITDATFRVADACYASTAGVSSEKIGSYSVTYKGTTDPYSVARRALRGTGLTYTGLNVPAQGVTLDAQGEPTWG